MKKTKNNTNIKVITIKEFNNLENVKVIQAEKVGDNEMMVEYITMRDESLSEKLERKEFEYQMLMAKYNHLEDENKHLRYSISHEVSRLDDIHCYKKDWHLLIIGLLLGVFALSPLLSFIIGLF